MSLACKHVQTRHLFWTLLNFNVKNIEKELQLHKYVHLNSHRMTANPKQGTVFFSVQIL